MCLCLCKVLEWKLHLNPILYLSFFLQGGLDQILLIHWDDKKAPPQHNLAPIIAYDESTEICNLCALEHPSNKLEQYFWFFFIVSWLGFLSCWSFSIWFGPWKTIYQQASNNTKINCAIHLGTWVWKIRGTRFKKQGSFTDKLFEIKNPGVKKP